MARVSQTASMAIDDDSGEEDEESVHSAMSNLSDFEDDEEVEYLAMELVNHLPPEQASKLLKNMRTKEKAVQDLLHRNRSLLDSCQQLDQENQVLTDRLKDSQSATPAAAAAPAPAAPAPAAAPAAPAAPAANVDTSYFAKMERGKEEKILILQRERDALAVQCRRLDEQARQMHEALEGARKEMKKLQQQVRSGGGGGGGGGSTASRAPRAAVADSLLDEEERLYQELQDSEKNELVAAKLQQRQEEYKKRIAGALETLLVDDLHRIQRWGSDIAALLLAVDGLEGSGKAAAKAAAKKGKAASGGGGAAGGERVSELQAALVDDFEALRAQLEDAEKAQLSVEQTCRGIQDGAEAAAVAFEVDGSLENAVREADGLAEHLARLSGLSLDATAELLERTEAEVGALLRDAPPGLLPPNAQQCLQGTQRQIAELCQRVVGQAATVAEIQAGSDRRLLALQAAHRAHRQEVRRRLAEELQRAARALEQPLEQSRQALRRQGEAVDRSRSQMSSALEELSAAVRRQATSSDGSAGAAAGDAHGSNESLAARLREVRGMCKSIIAGFEEGAKSLETRTEKVFNMLVGEEEAGASRGRTGGGAAATAGKAAAQEAASEAKKKKGKKKGKADVAPLGGPRIEEVAEPEAVAAPQAPAAEPRQAKPAALAAGAGGEAKRGSGPQTPTRGVVSGRELLQEMQALKGESEALEARMAERRKAKAKADDGLPEIDELVAGLEEAEEAKPAQKPRKKKMFV